MISFDDLSASYHRADIKNTSSHFFTTNKKGRKIPAFCLIWMKDYFPLPMWIWKPAITPNWLCVAPPPERLVN